MVNVKELATFRASVRKSLQTRRWPTEPASNHLFIFLKVAQTAWEVVREDNDDTNLCHSCFLSCLKI